MQGSGTKVRRRTSQKGGTEVKMTEAQLHVLNCYRKSLSAHTREANRLQSTGASTDDMVVPAPMTVHHDVQFVPGRVAGKPWISTCGKLFLVNPTGPTHPTVQDYDECHFDVLSSGGSGAVTIFARFTLVPVRGSIPPEWTPPVMDPTVMVSTETTAA